MRSCPLWPADDASGPSGVRFFVVLEDDAVSETNATTLRRTNGGLPSLQMPPDVQTNSAMPAAAGSPNVAADDPSRLLDRLRVRSLRVLGWLLFAACVAYSPRLLNVFDDGTTWYQQLWAVALLAGLVIGGLSVWVTRRTTLRFERVPLLGVFTSAWLVMGGGASMLRVGPVISVGVTFLVGVSFATAFAGKRAGALVSLLPPTWMVFAVVTDVGHHPPLFWLRMAMVSLLGSAVLVLVLDHLITSLHNALQQTQSALEQERAARQQWQEAQVELERSRRHTVISNLAGGVAHDVNNALMVVMGAAAILRDCHTPTQAQADLIEDIMQASRTTANTVKGLLHVAGRREGVQACAHVATLLPALCRNARHVLPEDLQLVEEGNVDDDVYVDLSPDELEQVLLNLVCNARDAMVEAGTHGVITVSASADVGQCNIRVSDDGPGIASDIREHIFEPYFTTKAQGKGTGLGLATSRGLLGSIGGSLALVDDDGPGATFCLTVPRAKGPVEDGASA